MLKYHSEIYHPQTTVCTYISKSFMNRPVSLKLHVWQRVCCFFFSQSVADQTFVGYKKTLWQCKIAIKFLAYSHFRYLSPVFRAGSEQHSQCPSPHHRGRTGVVLAGRKQGQGAMACGIFVAGKFFIGSMYELLETEVPVNLWLIGWLIRAGLGFDITYYAKVESCR